MNAGRPWVGDLVEDEHGRRAIVTDVKEAGTVWVLRPAGGGFTTQWQTTDPDGLEVIRRRGEHDTS
ncbi:MULTISPECIES: hypothetical protein [unclassified Streptomyces]|uniref:hypothetical protein n=1 Tax=unclassified Streptomyces TaxID=2593676 RepID=UPI002E2C7839|nr:hypothetical protein [Streptomyces sp. NBC_00272]